MCKKAFKQSQECFNSQCEWEWEKISKLFSAPAISLLLISLGNEMIILVFEIDIKRKVISVAQFCQKKFADPIHHNMLYIKIKTLKLTQKTIIRKNLIMSTRLSILSETKKN